MTITHIFFKSNGECESTRTLTRNCREEHHQQGFHESREPAAAAKLDAGGAASAGISRITRASNTFFSIINDVIVCSG